MKAMLFIIFASSGKLKSRSFTATKLSRVQVMAMDTPAKEVGVFKKSGALIYIYIYIFIYLSICLFVYLYIDSKKVGLI